MKKFFSLGLVLVALFGMIQITETPAFASTCEDVCYQDYLDCLGISSNPTVMCPNLYQNCLYCCENHFP